MRSFINLPANLSDSGHGSVLQTEQGDLRTQRPAHISSVQVPICGRSTAAWQAKLLTESGMEELTAAQLDLRVKPADGRKRVSSPGNRDQHQHEQRRSRAASPCV